MEQQGISEQLIEHLPDAVFVVDHDGLIVFVNAQAEALFGWGRDELLGRAIETLVPPATRAAHPIHRTGYVQDARVRSMGDGLELSGCRKDGSRFPAEISLSAIETETGRLITAVIRDATARMNTQAERDVSERKAFEGEVDRALDVAERAARSRQDFLANMSHEIRTPMNAIIGMTSLLMDCALENQQRDYVETVRASGEHLLTIINDSLDYAKIDAGKLLLEELPFDARDWMAATLDLIALQARGKNLELLHDVEPDVPAVLLGDPARLRQIVLNLLSNAVKFTHAGEVCVRMSARQSPDGSDWLRIVITDTGIGVGADRIELLFEPFTRADSTTTRLYGGTGLGLAISRRLAEEMGGTLALESVLGSGTRAELLVPVGRRVVAPMPIPAELAGNRILLVGASATGREIVAAWAGRCQAKSVRQERLVEVMALRLRLETVSEALPANVAPEDVRRCYEAGMDGFPAKPIVVESLAEVLRALVTEPAEPQTVAVLVDPQVVERLCDQIGADAVREIADLFFAEIDDGVPVLQHGCRVEDRAVLALTAHRLKSSARSLGAEPLGELLDRVEKQAADADWDVLTELVGRVQDQRKGVHDQLLAELRP